MGRIRNLVVLLIIIGLIIVGGTKGLLWYYTDKAAKDIQNTLPPGVFNYGGISTSLKGSTSIDDITLVFAGQNVRIEKLELASDNIIDLLTLIVRNWGSKIPNQIALRIQGININASSLLNNKQIADAFKYPYDIPCGKIKNIGLVEYMDMGYRNFVFDVDLAYQKVSAKRIKTSIGVNARDAWKTSASFYGEVDLLNPMVSSANSKTTIPEFQIQWSEDMFAKKLYNYCAAKENKPIDEYIQMLAPFSKQDIDQATAERFGLVFNEELINAFNDYVKNPKDLYIAAEPKGPITLDELKAMNEQVALELIRPSVRINGNKIPVTFTWISPDALGSNQEIDSKPKKPIIASSERRLTPLNELNAKAFNKNIEVHTTSGVVYKGAFRKVENGSLHMTIHKRLGTSDVALKNDVVRLVYILSDY